jgi:hypothetical protein|tara:strand:+ start:1317 stop:1811 length:495 start_codon:yes stop_codon:yes gene_type:complete
MNTTNTSLASPLVGLHAASFSMTEGTAIALLASSAIVSLLGLATVTIVLVAVTKQLRRIVNVLRDEEAGVHTSLLASANTPPDAFVVANRPVSDCGGGGGGSHPTSSSSSSSASSSDGPTRGILKKPTARMPTLTRHEKSSTRTDEHNTSCAIAEVDEEDDHTL